MNEFVKYPTDAQERELMREIISTKTIDEILKILPTLPYSIPVRGADGKILRMLPPEKIRLRIERIRHGHESIGSGEPNLSTDDTFKAEGDFEKLENTLPNFAKLRSKVRGLLFDDKVYRKALKRERDKIGKRSKIVLLQNQCPIFILDK